MISTAARTRPRTRRSVAPNRLAATPTPLLPRETWTVVASSLRLRASSASRRRAAVSATTRLGWRTLLMTGSGSGGCRWGSQAQPPDVDGGGDGQVETGDRPAVRLARGLEVLEGVDDLV